MIVYLDSSVIVRALLPDEISHEKGRELILESDDALITGSWTRVEVAAAAARAVKTSRADADQLRNAIDAIFDGQYVVSIDTDQAEVEYLAQMIVWQTAVRSLDAWHLACAQIAREQILEENEVLAFVSFDKEQASAAEELGFTVL